MSEREIAAMIREVLAEELGKLGGKKALRAPSGTDGVRHEDVAIASDGDLANFVGKILKYAGDRKTRSDIEHGRLVFRLAGAPAGSEPVAAMRETAAPHGDVATIASGFFSERQVDQLPKGTGAVRFGRTVKLTPLARDRLRRRGISIERTDT